MTHSLALWAGRIQAFMARPSLATPPGPPVCAADDAEFDELARGLFAFQIEHNAAYRRLVPLSDAAPGRVPHWTALPALPTAAFKKLEVTVLPAPARTAVFHSSGTTEQRPSRHFHDADSLAVYEASLRPWLRRHLLGDGRERMDCLFLTPPPEQAPRSSLVHMFETARKNCGTPASAFVGRVQAAGDWTVDLERSVARLREAAVGATPLALLGTAFNFVHLLDELVARGLAFALPPGSRVLETGGYKGRSRALDKPELHHLITATLGVPASHIVCEYGMSELSSQAYDARITGRGPRATNHEPRLFRFPPWARFQIIHPETLREAPEGQPGLLRVFDLANVASALAVQTEDLAIRQGDGFRLLGRAAAAEPRGCSLLTA